MLYLLVRVCLLSEVIHFLDMGCICSKSSYENISKSKSKKKAKDKPADLDRTMCDGWSREWSPFVDIYPQKAPQRPNSPKLPVEEATKQTAAKRPNAGYGVRAKWVIPRKYASEGGNSVQQWTTETLDGDYSLSEEVKLPVNVTVEESGWLGIVRGRWLYTNLVYFVQEITLLYDSSCFILFLTCRIADECTSKNCPEMTAGPHYTYLWTDSKGSTPVSVRMGRGVDCR